MVKSFFTNTTETKTPDVTPKNIVPEVTPLTYIESTTNNTPNSLPPTDTQFAGEKFIVKDGNIIASDNTVVTFISGGALSDITTTSAGWESHIVNVVPVNNVAPIIGAIPVEGLPGKYYISENSFGNREACEFSNKIFIYDSNTNVATLMYEENSSTLSHDDPRACNSEIFLLATENSSLILKYHTVGTNTLCDSAWSEPEKTFYLDVTNLSSGMKKYTISETLYNNAEQEEAVCRSKLSP